MTIAQRFRGIWAKFDPNGKGFIKRDELPKFLFELGAPLGWETDT